MASVTVAKVSGVPVRLHVTFLLVLPLFAYYMARAYFDGGVWPDAEAWLWGSLLAIGLFASVGIHELAHTLMALRHDIPVRHITLLPIGGVSAFAKNPEDPATELKVTAVGPLTNFVLAAPLLLAGWYGVGGEAVARFLLLLGTINLVLGVFNLFVPAFPMDGGRVLRALLARRMGRARATAVAARVGKGLAVVMGLLGLFGGAILLVLVAVFVYIGAEAESRATIVEEALGAFEVRDIMSSPVDSVAPAETVEEALRRMGETRHLALPVIDEGRAVGIVTLQDVSRVGENERLALRVSDIMRREVRAARPGEDATRAARMLAEGADAVVVSEGDRVVGIVTRTDIERAAMVQGVRGGRGPGKPAA